MKKHACLLLALIMVLSLISGCAESSGSSGTPNPTPPTTPVGSAPGPQVDKDGYWWVTDETVGVTYRMNKTTGFNVAIVNGYMGNTWRTQFLSDIEDAVALYKEMGIVNDVQVVSCDADITTQLSQINSFIAMDDIDAIIIDPVSPDAIATTVQKAIDKGILVVIANDPAAIEGTYCFAGDNYSLMKISTQWLCDKLEGKGDIVKLTGLTGNSADTLREIESEKILKNHPDINVLISLPGEWSATVSQQAMTTILSTYSSFDAVLAQDVGGTGVLQAFENAGRTPTLMTGDMFHGFLKKWKELGVDSITIPYCSAYGADALGFTLQILAGATVNPELWEPNPMDEGLVNAINLEPAYVVTNEAMPDADWMSDFKVCRAISLDEALDLCEGQDDNYGLDYVMTVEEIGAYFLDPAF